MISHLMQGFDFIFWNISADWLEVSFTNILLSFLRAQDEKLFCHKCRERRTCFVWPISAHKFGLNFGGEIEQQIFCQTLCAAVLYIVWRIKFGEIDPRRSKILWFATDNLKGPFKKYVLNRGREGSSHLTHNVTVREGGVLAFNTWQIFSTIYFQCPFKLQFFQSHQEHF